MSFQDELNRLASKPGNWSIKDCLNALNGTTNVDSRTAANTYAGTTNRSIQDAINTKAGRNLATQELLSKQDAAKLIP